MYLLGTHESCLNEAIPMNTYKILSGAKLTEVIIEHAIIIPLYNTIAAKTSKTLPRLHQYSMQAGLGLQTLAWFSKDIAHFCIYS